MFPEEFELLTPEIRHLEECIAQSSVSSRAEAMCFRISQTFELEDRDEAAVVLIEFSLPPYHPVHSPMVELLWPESCIAEREQQQALFELETGVRTEVLRENP